MLDFEIKDLCGNYAGFFFVDLTIRRSKVDLPMNLSGGISLFLVLHLEKLRNGIVKTMELTSVEASATDEADANIIMSKAKLVKKW
ncbi:hypothetical protein TNCV_4377331 [Trichonephila clavipes]|nr:hypothetical protein TNCV_4377331 [Trichonephila clavipes]